MIAFTPGKTWFQCKTDARLHVPRSLVFAANKSASRALIHVTLLGCVQFSLDGSGRWKSLWLEWLGWNMMKLLMKDVPELYRFLLTWGVFFKGAQLKTDSHLNNASNERLGSMMAEHVQCATCCSFLWIHDWVHLRPSTVWKVQRRRTEIGNWELWPEMFAWRWILWQSVTWLHFFWDTATASHKTRSIFVCPRYKGTMRDGTEVAIKAPNMLLLSDSVVCSYTCHTWLCIAIHGYTITECFQGSAGAQRRRLRRWGSRCLLAAVDVLSVVVSWVSCDARGAGPVAIPSSQPGDPHGLRQARTRPEKCGLARALIFCVWVYVYLYIYICIVCVELLNTSKTSIVASFWAFWFQQGDVAGNQGPRPTKLPDCMWYRAWSALRTCSIFPCVWQEAKPRTAHRFSCHVCLDLQLQSTSFFAQLVQSETAVTGQLPIYFCFGILHWNPVSCYSHDPSPGIRKRWSVFLHARCIPHDNSIRQFWGSVCVWTIWRDVQLLLGFGCTFGSLFEQKNWALCDWPSSTKLGHRVGYLDWPSRRACIFDKSGFR